MNINGETKERDEENMNVREGIYRIESENEQSNKT